MRASADASVRAMNALRRLVSALRTSGAGTLRHPGMSVAQLFALRSIEREPGLTMSDLADRTLTTPSAVSEVVAKLVARGLVAREQDPADLRRTRLRLTTDGREHCGTMEQSLPERLIAALATMDPAARDALAGALEAWVDRSGLGATDPAMFGETGTVMAER
jgi:DNA-binding MarR family transcriptional regulator